MQTELFVYNLGRFSITLNNTNTVKKIIYFDIVNLVYS